MENAVPFVRDLEAREKTFGWQFEQNANDRQGFDGHLGWKDSF